MRVKKIDPPPLAPPEVPLLEVAAWHAYACLVDVANRWWMRRHSAPAAPPARPPMSALAAMGLPADASVVDVKRRYRQLARHAHRDLGGSDAAFVRLHKLYEAALAEVAGR